MKKITKDKRKLFSDAHKITKVIKEKLNSKSKGDNKVDLTKLAKNLSERRERVIAEEETEEDEE